MDKASSNVSIKQIAEALHISLGTVSVVLNGRGDEVRISKATQQLVQDKARELGYRPNVYARRLRRSDNMAAAPVVSVFFPYSSYIGPYGRMIGGIQHAITCSKLSAEIIFRPFEYDKLSDSAAYLSEDACNGAVIFALSNADLDFLLENDFSIPIVIYDRVTEKYSSVYVDDYEAGHKVASLFAARGHRSVGMILSTNRNKSASMRQLGFTEGCRQAGIPIQPDCFVEDVLSMNGGQRAMAQLLALPNRPTAVFAGISDMAVGAMLELRAQRVRVPEELELISFGDNPLESALSPTLSTVRLPIEDMSEECLRLVLHQIETHDSEPVLRIFPTPLILRESCGGFPEK